MLKTQRSPDWNSVQSNSPGPGSNHLCNACLVDWAPGYIVVICHVYLCFISWVQKMLVTAWQHKTCLTTCQVCVANVARAEHADGLFIWFKVMMTVSMQWCQTSIEMAEESEVTERGAALPTRFRNVLYLDVFGWSQPHSTYHPKYPINTPFLLENTILHGKTSVYSWVCCPHLACLGLAWSMREVTKPRWSARDWADASQTKQCKGPSLGDFASLCKSILMDPLVVFGASIRTVPRMQSVALGSPHLMVATMLSCNFSLEAIRWMEGISVWCAAPSQLQGREMPAMLREASCDVHVFRPLILNREWWRVRVFDIAWSVSGNSSVTWSVTVVLCCCSRRSSKWHRPVAGWMQMHLSTVSFPGLVQGKLPLGKATDTRILRLGGQKLTMWLCPFSVDTPKSNS